MSRLDTLSFERLSPQLANQMISALGGTKVVLKRNLDRLSGALAVAKRIREGQASQLAGEAEALSRECGEIRRDLEQVSFRLLGFFIPLKPPSIEALSLTELLFGSEELFNQLTGARYEGGGINEAWLRQLKDLVIEGYRSITPLFARLNARTKSGLLVAVDENDRYASGVGPMLSSGALASNPKGPHPISGPFHAVPDRKSFEVLRAPAGRGLLPGSALPTMILDQGGPLAPSGGAAPASGEGDSLKTRVDLAAGLPLASAVSVEPGALTAQPASGAYPLSSGAAVPVPATSSPASLRRRKRFE